MGDQVGRHLGKFGRVLDDPAQALGGGAGGRVAEGGGVALDIMGGAKQLFAVLVRKAVLQNGGVRGREPVGLDRHPVLEFARQAGKGLFRALDGIVEILFLDAPQHLAQRIGLRDHVMVGEGLRPAMSRFSFAMMVPRAFAGARAVERALSSNEGCCRTSTSPPTRRSGPI